MSRLVVKNLPKTITEDKIRQIFNERGTLTDIQLKYTKDGKFRQFAFVGYQNDSEANEAVKYFNNTHIGACKITVECCSFLGDSKRLKPAPVESSGDRSDSNLRRAEIKSRKNEKKEGMLKKTKELLEKYKNDPLFEEFMQIHTPKEMQHLLDDIKRKEESDGSPGSDSGRKSEEQSDKEDETEKVANTHISDIEYMKALVKKSEDLSEAVKQDTDKKTKAQIKLFTVKLRGLPYSCKKKDIKIFFRPLVPYTIRIPPKVKGFAYAGFKTDKQFNQALLKDRSIILGRRVSVAKYVAKEIKAEMDQLDPKRKKWKTQEEALQNEESIAESGKIFLRNLSYVTTEEDIKELFAKYGSLTEVNLPVDRTTRKLKGFGLVTFLMPENAVSAYTELDGTVFHGRMLHLLPGKTKDDVNAALEETTNYKLKKASQQKKQAGSTHNWNSLFLGHDAVAEVVADTYGTTKEAVLDPHGSSSAAVRLALGETQIVTGTRKFLESEGVRLNAFNGMTTARSTTAILVKNLPPQTAPKEIKNVFGKFGVLGRVILPPYGVTGIVEYLEPSEARKAFTNLVYSKFKNLPLYLEWAPENGLLPKNDGEINKTEPNVDGDDKIADDDEEPEPDSTLFVKNLNFETTDAELRKHFESCGKIHYASVATKKDKSDPKHRLSMGYGFVCFMRKTGADKALKTLQQSSLGGKSLELKRSERTLQSEVKVAKKKVNVTKQTGTKILIRNIPFQANKKEVAELFRTFGEIRAFRLPKKMSLDSASHRGFAFVDYFTESDARKAFDALCQSTHLYGRRLVLEWAVSEDGVDHIRKRTSAHFHPKEKPRSKKSVLDASVL